MDRKNGLFYSIRRQRNNIIMLIPIIALGFLCPNVQAADLAGAKDHPLLKRFGGSEIVGYEVKRFDEFELQTSTFKRYNLETKRREFANPALKLEGSRTQIWYESAGDTSATELMRNYQNELKAKGFQILYDSKQDPNANMWVNFLAPFADTNIKTNCSYYIFYTDNVGGFDFNLNLSKRRADAVVAALTKEYGIVATRLTANGVAYLAPIAVNTSEEGQAKNRPYFRELCSYSNELTWSDPGGPEGPGGE